MPALTPGAPGAIVLGEKRDDRNDGWTRSATVDGREYRCAVRKGRKVQVSYLGPRMGGTAGKSGRPAGYGFHWEGTVYEAATGRCLFADRVPGSIGVRGLLHAAGVKLEENAKERKDRESREKIMATFKQKET